jgi:hypothetical protein
MELIKKSDIFSGEKLLKRRQGYEQKLIWVKEGIPHASHSDTTFACFSTPELY